MGRAVLVILVCWTLCVLGVFGINEELVAKLESTTTATKKALDDINSEWQIDKFPNFLKSCFMHKMSWEMMKLKFQQRILTALAKPTEKTKFVISFTGRYCL